MGRRGGLVFVVLAVIVAACGARTGSLDALPTLAPTSAPERDSPAPEPAGGTAVRSGRLAYIGRDGNVYVIDAGSDEPIAVTDDASFVTGGQGRIYESPTWSRGGWLSYVGNVLQPGEPLERVIFAAMPGGVEAPLTLFQTRTGSYEYGYWAPAECAEGDDCGRFSFLIFDEGAHQLHMAEVRSDSQDVQQRRLGSGPRSFYYSWAPDGERMLWLRAGAQLEVVDVNDVADLVVLPDELGVFQAPWWSPVDERWLFAQAGSEGNSLVVADGDQRDELTSESGSLIAFAWAPDGRRLAYVEGFGQEAWPFSVLKVLSDSGAEEVTLAEDGNVIAFFWSPDSQKIAFVSVAELEDSDQADSRASGAASPSRQSSFILAWHVADVFTGDTRELARFFPTQQQFYILQFFDQFAQSHNVWSPDSSQIVYAEVLPGGQRIVTVVSVNEANLAASVIAEGTVGIFSFE